MSRSHSSCARPCRFQAAVVVPFEGSFYGAGPAGRSTRSSEPRVNCGNGAEGIDPGPQAPEHAVVVTWDDLQHPIPQFNSVSLLLQIRGLPATGMAQRVPHEPGVVDL